MVLEAKHLRKVFQSGALLKKGQEKVAVDDVSFQLKTGESLAIVGESGSGKSTVARLVMRLIEASKGEIVWQGNDVTKMSDRQLRQHRQHIQMVFQDPFASLNPRMRIWESVAEGLRVHAPELNQSQRQEKVADMLERCGLSASTMQRYPHQFSGGQRQRIGIARALIVKPKVLVLDEPVSALDVSVQAQILNLLADIQADMGVAYLFISHDLSVVRHIAKRVLVMFQGKVVEEGSVLDVFTKPQHEYTQNLLAARPITHPSEREDIV
ncbi:MAG: ABC transporter ATP-binding protein [Mariprofundaceae bacterium]|nr:ABC transporter ATP-binding protein [Mariprofundaceae bacterium]